MGLMATLGGEHSWGSSSSLLLLRVNKNQKMEHAFPPKKARQKDRVLLLEPLPLEILPQLNLSGLSFLICKWGLVESTPLGCCEDESTGHKAGSKDPEK